MKYGKFVYAIAVTLAVSTATAAHAQGYDDDDSSSMPQAKAVDILKYTGHDCMTVSSFRELTPKGNGAEIGCNGDKLKYKIIPRGGIWTVIVISDAMAAPHTPIEPRASIGPYVTYNIIDGAASHIRANGHKCDSVSSMWQIPMTMGVTVSCNGNRYDYEVRSDNSGNISVIAVK